MGLDCSHGAWRGAYSAFTRWRNTIAQAAGYSVAKVQYEDGYSAPAVMIDWGHITEAQLHGEWEETPSDPLLVLIAHSDCDGVIKPEQAEPLAARLEELVDNLPTEDAPGHIGNWRSKTQSFIDGLRKAAAAGENLEFF